MRNTLLASISHDLRTPLSAIAGAGSIVAQKDFALDIYRRETLGRLIEDKARDMADLLSKVLELVSLESGEEVLNRSWHSLEDIVGSAIQRYESKLVGWQVTVNLQEELPLMMVDQTLLVQVLTNVLENATKYTAPGTHIDISAFCTEATVLLVVEDDGPGWGVAEPERLFDKFARAKSESPAGGVGLGLSICRAIVNLHAGAIRAVAGATAGARLEIELPIPVQAQPLVAMGEAV
jgi:two-component system sensor histidine kinase KdpD